MKKERKLKPLKGVNLERVEDLLVELEIVNITDSIEKAHALMEAADAVLTQICSGSDSIKIDAWEEIKECLEENVTITKPFFFELVNIRRKKLFGELNVDDSLMQKMETELGLANSKIATRRHMYNDLAVSDDNFKRLLSKDSTIIVTESDAEYVNLDKRIITIIDECATTRQNLNAVLWPKLKLICLAYQHACNGDPTDFWDMLQFYHYRSGGYPNENTPPKLWSVIDKYRRAVDLNAMFGYDLLEKWNKRFGLEIIVSEIQKEDINNYNI